MCHCQGFIRKSPWTQSRLAKCSRPCWLRAWYQSMCDNASAFLKCYLKVVELVELIKCTIALSNIQTHFLALYKEEKSSRWNAHTNKWKFIQLKVLVSKYVVSLILSCSLIDVSHTSFGRFLHHSGLLILDLSRKGGTLLRGAGSRQSFEEHVE